MDWEDTETLDEVVVVGYGVQKKVNLTGAVASVDFEEQTKSRPITTVSSALAGLSPGLQASSGSACSRPARRQAAHRCAAN